MLQRRLRGRLLRQAVEQRPELVREPPEHRVREGHGPLEPRPPDQLDGLVDCGVARDAVEVAELVRAEPQRRADGRVELVDAAPPDALERVVEGAPPLHGPEGKPARQLAVALVEARDGGAQRPVGVGALLEDPQENRVRGGTRRGDGHRRPRTNSS